MNWTTLVSTGLGAAIALASGLLIDKSRWKRQLDQSWRDRRFDSYQRFLAVMHEQVSVARSLATAKGLMAGPSPVELEEGLRQIADADHRLAPAYEAVQILGGVAVGGTAQAWRKALWQLSDYACGREASDPAKWEDAYREYRLARDDFQKAARAELGIPGDGFRRSPWEPSTRTPDGQLTAEPPDGSSLPLPLED